MPLPDLHDYASFDEPVLPLGVHRATMAEIESHFVLDFAGSSTRREIFDGLSAFRTFIRGLVPEIRSEFINGSFVTGRLNPKDVDMSLWIEADVFATLPSPTHEILVGLFTGALGPDGHRFMKERFRCDTYMVPYCEVGHASYLEFDVQKRWTEHHWSRYKDKNGLIRGDKGYVEVIGP